jgi:hypothetical protein
VRHVRTGDSPDRAGQALFLDERRKVAVGLPKVTRRFVVRISRNRVHDYAQAQAGAARFPCSTVHHPRPLTPLPIHLPLVLRSWSTSPVPTHPLVPTPPLYHHILEPSCAHPHMLHLLQATGCAPRSSIRLAAPAPAWLDMIPQQIHYTTLKTPVSYAEAGRLCHIHKSYITSSVVSSGRRRFPCQPQVADSILDPHNYCRPLETTTLALFSRSS